MERSRERRIKGLGVSPGIVIGRVFRLESGGLSYSARRIPHTLIPLEIQRFHNALKRSREEIAEVKERILARGLHQQAYILEVHQQLLEDRMLIEETEKLIKEKLINAEWALEIVLKKITEVFEGINEEYIRERKGDIKQVIQRLIKNLAGEASYELEEVEAEEVVVVAHDLSPAETIQLNLKEVAGFATDAGGWTSHTAIVARSLAIPAVVALGEITASTQGGERIILDGTEGLVVIEPTEATVREYELKKQRYKYVEREL
ncbi:MAG: phosphoenolpyruvate--protein phosphotransferase, partial [Deltaproteobacteria bacterium]